MSAVQSPPNERWRWAAHCLISSALAFSAGCRDSAPDDLIGGNDTTEALVFVKTTAEETLNRTWAEGNLYKLSPIAPD
ncbi:MAG TPA: hypothetical protein VFR10_14345, partial [bacterium]|nr:hypothetical protein [bacterium]